MSLLHILAEEIVTYVKTLGACFLVSAASHDGDIEGHQILGRLASERDSKFFEELKRMAGEYPVIDGDDVSSSGPHDQILFSDVRLDAPSLVFHGPTVEYIFMI